MDKLCGKAAAVNKNNANNLYKSFENSNDTDSSPWIHLAAANNNNNEKINDANQTMRKTSLLRKEADFRACLPAEQQVQSPLNGDVYVTSEEDKTNDELDKKQKTNSTMTAKHFEIMHANVINNDDDNDDEDDNNDDDNFETDDKISDNQSDAAAADEHSTDNNSTDNLSFITDDANNGLIDDIILLPNNLLSEDELSTNSDDCVYAYRGADFDPIRVNPEDETDYLEMDFEPDPASEIEQESLLLNAPNNSHSIASPLIFENSNMNEALPLPNPLNGGYSADFNRQIHLNEFNADRSEVKDWIKPIEVPLNVIWKENRQDKTGGESSDHAIADGIHGCDADDVSVKLKNSNRLDANLDNKNTESNKSVENKENKHELLSLPSTSSNLVNTISPSSYYDKTAVLSIKKYTGTIPKTNRFHVRPTRMKATTIGGSSTLKSSHESHLMNCTNCTEQSSVQFGLCTTNAVNPICKRWKHTEDASSPIPPFHDRFVDETSLDSIQKPIKSAKNTKRSMSFPFEEFTGQQNECGLYDQNGCIDGQLHVAHSQIHLCSDEKNEENEFEKAISQLNVKRLEDWHEHSNGELFGNKMTSVTFCSTNITLDTIINALEKIDVHLNVSKLQEQLNAMDCKFSTNPSLMNIPEYLVYMSKRNGNFKAIIAAIEASCEDVDAKFFPATDEPSKNSEIVQIPVTAILSRVPYNGSLKNILSIRNNRFHKMNVLGKIVNAIRKFSDMRHDIIYDNYITIPQYYRNGFICVTKKSPPQP